jgi:signal transduction histidine kinase
MSTDITHVKRLHRELAILGETLAGVAHTIRNVLNGLEGGAYVLQSGLRRQDPMLAEEGWNMVRENVDLIAHLVKDILYCAKERKPEYEKVNVNEISRQVHGLFEKKAREMGIEFIIEDDDKIGEAIVDRMGIHSALTDLVTNAIDACLADKEKLHHLIRLRTGYTNENIFIEVSDNGIGMNQEVKDKIFKGFFSTKGGKGTGLGLLKVAKVVREHGGNLSLNSYPGIGTTIRINIPRYPIAIDAGYCENRATTFAT